MVNNKKLKQIVRAYKKHVLNQYFSNKALDSIETFFKNYNKNELVLSYSSIDIKLELIDAGWFPEMSDQNGYAFFPDGLNDFKLKVLLATL